MAFRKFFSFITLITVSLFFVSCSSNQLNLDYESKHKTLKVEFNDTCYYEFLNANLISADNKNIMHTSHSKQIYSVSNNEYCTNMTYIRNYITTARYSFNRDATTEIKAIHQNLCKIWDAKGIDFLVCQDIKNSKRLFYYITDDHVRDKENKYFITDEKCFYHLYDFISAKCGEKNKKTNSSFADIAGTYKGRATAQKGIANCKGADVTIYINKAKIIGEAKADYGYTVFIDGDVYSKSDKTYIEGKFQKADSIKNLVDFRGEASDGAIVGVWSDIYNCKGTFELEKIEKESK